MWNATHRTSELSHCTNSPHNIDYGSLIGQLAIMRILPQLQHQILCLCGVNQSFPGILIKEKSEEIVESLLCLIYGTINNRLVSYGVNIILAHCYYIRAYIFMINRLGQNLILVAYQSKKNVSTKFTQTKTLNNERKFIALNINY